jgi:RNA polymerase sigma-70 factor (ECF subfamily)
LEESLIADAMKKYGNSVLRVAVSVTGNLSDAEDVFSDVFFALWRCGKVFSSEEHQKAWLIRVAVNKSKNIRKQAFNRYRAEPIEHFGESAFSEVYPNSPYSDTARELNEAMSKLKPKDRAIIYLHYYEGYTYGEIGRMLGMRENSVRSKALRAREEMKGFLEGKMTTDN